jgi:DNA-binding MarR family transcriptional regulator
MNEVERPLFSLFHIGNSIQALNKHSEKTLGISLVQWCLLRCLIDMPASSANSLAKAVSVHPSTLTQTLKRLDRKNFIFITEDPKDSRKKLISITRSGKDVLEKTGVNIQEWTKDLSVLEGDLHRLRSYLQDQVNKETRLEM